MKTPQRQHSPSRRNFLRACATTGGAISFGSLGFFGSSLVDPAPVAAAPLSGHKRLVVINLFGGNDGLNTVVPTALSRYYDRRPTIAIAAPNAVALSGGPNGSNNYHLHPSFVRSEALWNAGEMAAVNQVGYPSANLSHFVSQDIWSYAIRSNVTGSGSGLSGWMARYADNYATTPTGIVAVRSGRPTDFFGGSTDPLMVSSLAGFNFVRDWRAGNDDAYRKVVVRDVVDNGSWSGSPGLAGAAASIGQSYDLAGQIQDALSNYTSTVDYPNANPSLGLKDVATLIQAGFDTKMFFVSFGGYDTHSDQATRHASLMASLDTAIGAFSDDLKAMGAWQDTVIVVISEFGRRHEENGSKGTDHGHASCVLLYGGAINGGLYGPEHTNADIDLKYGDYRIDFRTIYRDIVQNHLGANPDTVFPEAAEISDSPGGLIA